MDKKQSPRFRLSSRQWLLIACGILAVMCVTTVIALVSSPRNADAVSAPTDSLSAATQDEIEFTGGEYVINPIDFSALQEENIDIYAWMILSGAEIEEPILQNAMDTDYYLNRTVEGTAGLPGALYTRNDTPQDFSGTCTIVYGHNMEDDKTMFSTLHRFESAEFFADDANRTIQIYTPGRLLEYEIFAAVRYSDVLLTAAFDFDAADGTGTQAFVESLRSATGFFDSDVALPDNPRLLVLSTCMNLSANAADERYLVVGVLTNEQVALAE